jgi:transposase, IS30 family
MAHQLTPEERDRLCLLHAYGRTSSEIARCLRRHKSTISRELRRNAVGGCYSALAAQRQAEARRRQRPLTRKMQRPDTNEYVRGGLARYWSPEQIAGRLRQEFPDEPRRWVSHQTIYAWIARDDYREHWRKFLRHGGRKRSGPEKRGKIVAPVGVADRPAAANERRRLGDWEGDTVVSRRRKGGVVTLVDRCSRYTLIEKVRDLKATTTAAAVRASLGELPRELRRTMTLDRGKEFAGHETFAEALQLDVYFADPYAAWQRGTVENTNGLLRQFFPKGTDFRAVRRPQLQQAQELLNNRPRKCLDYQSPAEVLRSRLSVAFEI